MEEVIKSLEEYVQYIQALSKEYLLSRGQEYDKPLLPSA